MLSLLGVAVSAAAAAAAGRARETRGGGPRRGGHSQTQAQLHRLNSGGLKCRGPGTAAGRGAHRPAAQGTHVNPDKHTVAQDLLTEVYKTSQH